MKRFHIYTISFLLLTTSCEVGWYDVWNEYWDPVPMYISENSLEFGEEGNALDFHIRNDGSHDEVRYEISCDCVWLIVSPSSGIIQKDSDVNITVEINRHLLAEGENTGNISIKIDGETKIINVSAIGDIDIAIDPEDKINFGISYANKTFSIRSNTGERRVLYLKSETAWLTLDRRSIVLPEFSEDDPTTVVTITASCNRENLAPGSYEGAISITSEGGKVFPDYKAFVYIPEQDELIQQVEDYVFSITKTPYRDTNGNVIVELNIENASNIFSNFKLNNYTSSAIGEDERAYKVYAVEVNVRKKETEVMKILVASVPDEIHLFTSLTLDYSLSSVVTFQNLNF